MKDLDCLCAGCWNELTECAVCAECGFDNDTQNETINLGINIGSSFVYLIASLLIIYYFLADKELVRKTFLKLVLIQ